MTYIILAAGKGANLNPLTLKFPKTSFKLDDKVTVLQNLVRSIRKYDKHSQIIVVAGYLSDFIKNELNEDNVKVIVNPFYEVTNSITSLWFARKYLEDENVTILHGDVVFEDLIIKDIVTKKTDFSYVTVDSTINKEGCYNAVLENGKVLVMSKKLEQYNAKYACITKLDAVSARLLKEEVDNMVYSNMYDQYFEDALVQMILFKNFELGYVDLSGKCWTEVDNVDDLLRAKEIIK